MGFSVVTTVLAKAASYGLTDLTTAQAELGLTDTTSDTWLALAIRRVSATVSSYVERVFVPELVQDVFDIQQDAYPAQTPGGVDELQLSRWPVLGILSVVLRPNPASSVTLVQDVDFRLDPTAGQLLRLNPASGAVVRWEAVPLAVQYVGGFGALALEGGTVPAAAPFQVTVSQATTFSCDYAVAYAAGAALTRVGANPGAGQYTVAAGVYTFSAADAGALLTLEYAVAAIPDDILDVVLQVISGRFSSKDRDPALVQRETPGVGIERFWIGTSAGQDGPFPPDLTAILDNYKMPMVA